MIGLDDFMGLLISSVVIKASPLFLFLLISSYQPHPDPRRPSKCTGPPCPVLRSTPPSASPTVHGVVSLHAAPADHYPTQRHLNMYNRCCYFIFFLLFSFLDFKRKPYFKSLVDQASQVKPLQRLASPLSVNV